MIKILYIIGTLDIGGTERHLVEVVRRLDRTRFEPHVCVLDAGGQLQAEIEAAGVPVFVADFRGLRRSRPPAAPASLLAMSRRVVRHMRRERFDIVHGYLFWAYVLGAFCGKAARVPAIVAGRRSLGHFKAAKPHYLFLERLADGMTDLFVANSEAVRADTIRRERIAPSKIRVIRNGIDLCPFLETVDRRAKRRELGIDPDAPLLAVIANYIRYKGHRYLFEALRRVRDAFPAVVCLCVGEGPMRREMEARIAASGLAGNVILAGTRRDVPELLAAADISVLPSLEEGFSNAILESMAAGRPVVATAVGGNPEAVADGVTGILVPPGDSRALAAAILRLLGDAALADRMGREGRKRVQAEFAVEKMIAAMEAMYLDLASAPGRRRKRKGGRPGSGA